MAIRLLVTAAAVVVAGLGFLLGTVEGVSVAIVCVFVINGVWVGAAEQVAGFAAVLLALVLSGAVGQQLEPVVASAAQTGGLAAELIARALAVLVVAVPLGITLGVVLRVLMKKHPAFARVNTWLGAGFGFAEGALVALAVLWIPVLLGPVASAQAEAARARTAAPAEEGQDPTAPTAQANAAVAEFVAAWARALRGSMLEGVATATAPTKGVEMIALANEFAEITRDQAAMDALLNDPVMVEINELPSVRAALDRLRHDDAMRAAIQGEPITPERLWAILQSDTVLRAVEETGAMEDVASRAPEIARAIAEVRREGREGWGP